MSSATQSHKRKNVRPQLVVGTTVSATSRTSLDHRRLKTKVSTLSQAATTASTRSEEFWADDVATNEARHAAAFSYQLGDDSLEPQMLDLTEDGISVQIHHAPSSKKTYRPLRDWWPLIDEYLGENLRREGRGAPKNYSRCPGPDCPDRRRRENYAGCDGAPEWRCVDQACFGEQLYCSQCIVEMHRLHPTHFVEKWDGTHFVRKRTWLQELGLVIQLGHPPGAMCPFGESAAHDFVLYDLTGVHELSVRFCGCRTGETNEKLERRVQLLRACWWPASVHIPNTCVTFRALRLFQLLNCLGKLSAYDFLRGLELFTNNDGLNPPPDRRRPFMCVMRQWREVKRQKRAKRGHAGGGVFATGQGELALQCRACPQPGWNLPEGWENIDPFFRYLYCVFLAVDANFRLSNRDVSSEAADPLMGDGWGYFCRRYGEDGYNAHVAKHANEEELSNCSGFQAMSQANSKRTKGLRATGVVGVICGRHNMWRPNGVGDLQVGERQCNVDFVVLSAVLSFALLLLIISYDIACQYSVNFWRRMPGLPSRLHLKLREQDVWWKIPNFHLPAHKRKCHSPFSFHWMKGAGRSHGEGIEENWSLANGAAKSTRLMSLASRQITLEDIFGAQNYARVLALPRVLLRRLAVAIKEGIQHKAAFDAFSKGLKEARPEEVNAWEEWVERWESTQHTTAEDSPFETKDEERTLRDIQLQIATEEFTSTGGGVEVEREHTPGSFVADGLSIEEAQRKLTVDIHAVKEPTPTQRLEFMKRRTVLRRRIKKFREVQRIYMPSIRNVLSDAQRQTFDGLADDVPEATRLFMPSEIEDERSRVGACAVGLPEIEARMREGEAVEALEAVRKGLRTRTMTNRYKLRNYTGQELLTRGQGILRQINVRIHTAKLRYRYARAAHLTLRGHGAWEEKLRVLTDDDVRALNERALTAEEKAQNEHWAEIGGAIIEGGIERAAGVARGEGSHTLSWIWYTTSSGEVETDDRLEEALRVEWCKARARCSRYEEEVRLLREEMRRTIAYGRTAAGKWDDLAADELVGAPAEVTEGRRAYAAEEAATERARCADLEKRWRPILAKADAYLRSQGGADVSADDAVLVDVDMRDELGPDEEEARLEGGADEEDDV